MCQAALADLKMAIRAAGEHKQRIAVQVSIDGLRLRDEKTGDCLYHHPVHKISFIAQDMSDSRAFGYIFGSPDTGHRFFGIKTDKAASQVVIAMRDLFQVVFELKKKEIELAKQHIEQNAIKFHTSGIFVEPAPDTKGAAGSETSLHRNRTLNSEIDKPVERKQETQSGVIADLLDLQFELNSLQQGIHQMDKITPDNPRPSSEDPFETDPFGDSFANMKVKETVQPILPPPPSSAKRGHLERQQTVPVTSSSSSPATILASKTPPPQGPPQGSIHWFDKETENLFNEGELSSLAKNSTAENDKENESSSTTPSLRKSPQIDVFTELDPLGTGLIKPYVDKKDFFQHLKNPPKKVLKDLVTTSSGDTFPTNFNVTAEPIEPVKVQSSVFSSKNTDNFEDSNFADFDKFDESEVHLQKTESPKPKKESYSQPRPTIHHQPLSVSLPPEEISTSKDAPITYPIPNTAATISAMNKMEKESAEPIQTLVRLPSPKKYLQSVRRKEFDIDLAGSRTQSLDKPFPVDFSATSDSPASPLRSCSSEANSRLSSSSAELEIVPEPPPRGAGSILINPPPLPPKKSTARSVIKPPPRPPYTEGHFHYDFLEREETSPSPTRKERNKSPSRDLRNRFDDDFSPPPPQLPKRSELVATFPSSKIDDSFESMTPTTLSSIFQSSYSSRTSTEVKRSPKPSLDITLSQLTSSNLAELAGSLNMTVSELTSLTLQQLTECLATLSNKDLKSEEKTNSDKNTVSQSLPAPTKPPQSTKIVETSFISSEHLFKANFDQEMKDQENSSTYDKYAVFRELLELEQQNQKARKEEKNEDHNAKEEEAKVKVPPKEQEISLRSRSPEKEIQSENSVETITSLANLTVQLPPLAEDSLKTQSKDKFEDSFNESCEIKVENEEEKMDTQEPKEDEGDEKSLKDQMGLAARDSVISDIVLECENEENLKENNEEKIIETLVSNEPEKYISSNKENDEEVTEKLEETNGVSTEKTELKGSNSTSSDRYAALREIIEESEQAINNTENKVERRNSSPSGQPVSKTLAEIDLMSLFSSPLPAPPSPKKSPTKQEEDLKVVAMDIFEEIKMLNSGTQRSSKESKTSSSGFEDVFSPFPDTKNEKDPSKDETNWAKFESNVFHSDKSFGEGPGSIGGTSPWSPDGKEFHKGSSLKGNAHRHSGDSDNECKDEEGSEESNGRFRDDGSWSSKGPRYEYSYEERSYYEVNSCMTDKERDCRNRTREGRKSRGAPWTKTVSHRTSRDPSPWYEDGRWEEELQQQPLSQQQQPQQQQQHRRYLHRTLPYKDHDEDYKTHWKCRPKQRPWNGERDTFWSHDHPSYEEERGKRRMMLWNDEDRDRDRDRERDRERDRDRFSSQESMGYDDEERCSRREYERRRWEEDGRFWGRRGPETDYPPYPPREPYRKHESHCCRDGRDRPHDYPSGWLEEDYGPEHVDESPRYLSRKRHWPKRPNSATDARNLEPIYTDPRPIYGVSRSECSDNDSDPYHRPHRSRSRESYWGSDQEYDTCPERSYWLEGPELKNENLHHRRMNRHKRRTQVKSQNSPFEDDFSQSLEHVEPDPDPFTAETRLPIDQDIKLSEPSAISPRSGKDIPRTKMHKKSGHLEDDLTPTPSLSSEPLERQKMSSDTKMIPEESCVHPSKDPPSNDSFVSEHSGRDSFFNGDPRFDDDAFTFKSELEDNVPEKATTLPLKNSRQMKGASGKVKTDHYIKKSESVNIFVRESDPFDDDDFFN
ncbi:protein disabled isoform X2 [Cephus cinctus]|nr:protein disabled isoform X2 [Cephus cinctus]